MTKHLKKIEVRSAEPTDTPEDLTAATAAVEELRTASEQFRSQTDQRITTEICGVTDRLAAIETRLSRPGTGQTEQRDEPSIEQRAFVGFIRQGREALSAEEVRALQVSDDTSGGYLAPAQFVAEVIKGIVEMSPVRQAARVGNTAAGEVILPKRTGRPTGRWVGENEDTTETGSTYGQVEIPVHEMACYVDVSQRLLEDSAVNIEGEVSYDLAEEFARLEALGFMQGDGIKKPLGIMKTTGVTYKATGNASTLGTAPADTLIDAFYSLPAAYRSRATWMMNGSTLAAVRKLKDGSTGAYLWQPGLVAGQPATILGRPVVEDSTMDDVGAAAVPIIFGDFGSAYRIYDRVALSIMRDPYSVATKGLVRFHARRRTGGGMVLTEALRTVKCATS